MFKGFTEELIEGDGANLFVRHAGPKAAPAVLLLHGYPQTSAMWHKVAPKLAEFYHVICPDLRGYGRSDKPPSDDIHSPYSKRAMARDLVALMHHLGHDHFLVGAHDRGARVAHRMGLDFPDKITAMTLLDIAPTREMYAGTNAEFAKIYWHWFFLIQKHPIPEQIIGSDPVKFWKLKCFNQAGENNLFDKDALAEYLSAFSSPESIHASCEDYRAAATIDIEHDNSDKGRKLTQPVLALWAKHGVIATCFDALKLWQQRAEHVEGDALDATHYMAEEIPDEITKRMTDFFSRYTKQVEVAQ